FDNTDQLANEGSRILQVLDRLNRDRDIGRMIGNWNGIAIQVRAHKGDPAGKSFIPNRVHACIRLDQVVEERAQAAGATANVDDAPANTASSQCGRGS